MIMGDVREMLGRESPDILDVAKWSRRDSDVIAHAIQVHGQIISSRWARSDITFITNNQDKQLSTFPTFEDFVFAAVYFRQMIAGDKLLHDAVKRYGKHVACGTSQIWMQYELDRFERVLESKTFPITIGEYTAREIVDAFFYGASLFHDVPPPESIKRQNFKDIHDNHRREHVLFALNGAMLQLLKHVNNIVLPLQKHFAHWQQAYSIPLPDIHWHSKIFDTEQKQGTDEVKLGVATYRWSMRG